MSDKVFRVNANRWIAPSNAPILLTAVIHQDVVVVLHLIPAIRSRLLVQAGGLFSQNRAHLAARALVLFI